MCAWVRFSQFVFTHTHKHCYAHILNVFSQIRAKEQYPIYVLAFNLFLDVFMCWIDGQRPYHFCLKCILFSMHCMFHCAWSFSMAVLSSQFEFLSDFFRFQLWLFPDQLFFVDFFFLSFIRWILCTWESVCTSIVQNAFYWSHTINCQNGVSSSLSTQ